ncbi:MAG: gliding motility-associated C-terminal domain-containing protein [Crocinitomicaceae bacterium]|nr:gliding motility-associated C-terminal domain-containing protein [Crocinitomicaceae bacterium]
MARSLLILLLLVFTSFLGRASHSLGGDITWTCQGGQYVFQLVFYRDCNGAVINNAFVTIDVAGHPTITSINLDFISSSDVSPFCTQVPGGPAPLDCGVGQGGGNGVGAIEKAIYRSQPMDLPGTPPAEGWLFGFESFSRSNALTNIQDPSTSGMTITAKMFAIPNSPGGCVDNSPQFLQEPYFVSCVGDQYEYNPNAIDPDLDSIHVSFGDPLDGYSHLAQIFDPPNSPLPVVFVAGFSANSPTPGPAMNPGNVSAQVDPSSGNITFLSNNSGNFAVKIVAQSFRDGVLIAEVEREIQLIVVNCNGNNNAPVITGPFGGLFETTINAGDLVNFNLASTDVELLQDGTPQDNILSATGPMFGTNYTSALGCAIAPCATLDATPLITMSQGVNTTFNWQTSCDHLVTPYGGVAEVIPYHFVFKVQDNYCDVPKVSYATITINVENPGVVPAPEIECITTNAAGDVTINWTPVVDPLGTFAEYRVYSLQSGLLGTIANINTGTFTDIGVAGQVDYYITTASGCNGNTLRESDTISNIFLTLNNPLNGTAVLQWNDPINPALPDMGAYYHIYREYPAGTWTLHDSVPYGTHFYKDTITICDVFLSYQIVLPNQPCDYTSNIEGDQFEDMISPDIPILNFVTIDSLTNEVTINWNQNAQPDTYGYIIYVMNAVGAIVELDQVFGISDTSYTYSPNITQGPLTYTVAAFDSCWTATVPPTYQTSAKGEIHTTSFASSQLNICDRTVSLSWTEYIGWTGVDHYEVFGKTDNLAWSSYGTTNNLNFLVDVIEGENYTFVIQAVSDSGVVSFSNVSTIYISSPGEPAYNYLQVGTVIDDLVQLRHIVDNSVNIADVSIQREEDGVFIEIARLPITSGQIIYDDEDVQVQERSYNYRIQVIDSCGREGSISNEARTILLTVDNDDVRKINYLFWSSYEEFDGGVLAYNVYRGIDDIFNGGPIVTLPPGEFSYEDDVNAVYSKGKVCYYVEAIEADNLYNFSELSHSNRRCITLPPIIYIPNAFMPDGINKIFLPILSDFDPLDYDLSIFDNWGRVIFKTNLPDEGWNGNIALSGKMAEPGVYTYMVTLHDGDGIEIIKRGHVTLLK